MGYCSHNEVDLEPDIVALDEGNGRDADWVVVRCCSCEEMIGKRYRLIDLVDKAITARRAKLED